MTAARYTPNIRIKSEDRSLIDWAAKAQCKTRTNVILEAARRAAENELLDQTVAHVSVEAYANFLARLDASLCSQRPPEACHADKSILGMILAAPVPTQPDHDAAPFSCGQPSLDDSLKRHAIANQMASASSTGY